jgi:hypothetical protein
MVHWLKCLQNKKILEVAQKYEIKDLPKLNNVHMYPTHDESCSLSALQFSEQFHGALESLATQSLYPTKNE